METMDSMDPVNKLPGFSETQWTQWTLLHPMDKFTRERLVAGSNPAGPTLVSQKCETICLNLELGAV